MRSEWIKYMYCVYIYIHIRRIFYVHLYIIHAYIYVYAFICLYSCLFVPSSVWLHLKCCCLSSCLVATAFIDGCTDGEDFGALVTAVPAMEWTESTMYILPAWNFPSVLPLEIWKIMPNKGDNLKAWMLFHGFKTDVLMQACLYDEKTNKPYVYTYIYIYLFIYLYRYIFAYTHLDSYTQIHVYIYISISTLIHKYIRAYIYIQCSYIDI